MTVDLTTRVVALEEQVAALTQAVAEVVAFLQASAQPPEDKVGASFRRFQQDADRQTGRG